MGIVQLVHHKRAHVPADSEMAAAPVVACCSVRCVRVWASVRRILSTDIDMIPVPADPRSACAHCANCGRQIVEARNGYCGEHGASCPSHHFLSTTAAYVFIRLSWMKFGEAATDEMLELAEKTWDKGQGVASGKRLLELVREVLEA